MRHSELRRRLFSTLLGDPDAEWTAKVLATVLAADFPEGPAVVSARTHAVRDTLHVLMADRWVEPVPFQRALTVRLTALGRSQLSQLLSIWSTEAGAEAGEGGV